MFSELLPHRFLCQTHFPFMRDFGKKGFKGVFVLVTWTGSVFRAYPSKRRAVHLEGWQALQKQKKKQTPVEVKIEAAYQTLQMIHLNFTRQ